MPEIETVYGRVKIGMDGNDVTISTQYWAEASQVACLTRAQFTKFIEQCQEILAHMPEE